jgi:hypothetical protein
MIVRSVMCQSRVRLNLSTRSGRKAAPRLLQRVPVMLTHSPASSPCLPRRSIFAREKMDPRVEPAGDVRLSHLDRNALQGSHSP